MQIKDLDPSPRQSFVIPSTTTSPTQSLRKLTIDIEEPAPENAALAFANSTFPEWNQQSTVIVICCSAIWFCFLGIIYVYGLFSDALLQNGVANASSLALIGAMGPGIEVAFSIPAAWLSVKLGVAKTAVLGSLLCGVGPLLASFFTHSYVGLLLCHGLIFGTGCSLCFNTTASLASQYFLKKRGVATGIIFGSGSIGSAVLSIAVSRTISTYGVAWAFRLLGILTLAISLPAACFLKERFVSKDAGRLSLVLFKDTNFNLLFASGLLAALPIFTVPYLLPTFARTLGLTENTSAWLLVAYSLASFVGRIGTGILSDSFIGPLNSVILTQITMCISLLVVWTVSSSITPLIFFVSLNGFSSGGYFAQIGPVIASLFKSYPTRMVVSVAVTGWIVGNFAGSPISGALLEASASSHGTFVRSDYLGVIMFAGSIAVASTLLLMLLRYRTEPRLFKKL